MPPRRPRSRGLVIFTGAFVSGWLIWLVFRKIDFAAFQQSIREANPFVMALAIVAATLGFPLRVPRWRLLLPPRTDGSPLATASLWHATTIGFTANTLIPLRVGEVVRAATVARLEKLPFATCFASLAVERALDGLVMVALLGLGLVTSDISETAVLSNGTPLGPIVVKTGLIALAATLIVVAAAWQPAITLRLVRTLVPSRPSGERFIHFTEQVLTGLGALRDPARAVPVIGWSVVLWVVNAAAFWLGAIAFGIDIPFTAAFVLQGVVVVGIALPAAPGGLGTFEVALIGGLLLYGIDKSLATAYALTFHLTTMVPIILLGLWSLRRAGGSLTGKDLPDGVAAP